MRTLLLLILVSVGLLVVERAEAQGVLKESTPTPNKSRLRTSVSVELLTAGMGGVLETQRWGAACGRIGVEFRTRTAAEGKAEVKERQQGTLRIVQVIAIIEADGRLSVPGRRFSLEREQAFGDWIRELQTFGSLGQPLGKPGFGLSKEQFEALFKILEQPVARAAARLDFAAALEAVGQVKGCAMRLTAEAEERLRHLPKNWKTANELSGVSRGTALAILLADAGLAFRPSRTPDGELELVVVLLDEPGTWPIGWPLEQPPFKVMPKMVELMPIEFDDLPLAMMFQRAAKASEVPVLIDQHRIAAKNLDLQTLRATQLPKRTMWSLVLVQSVSPHHLLRENLVDEGGRAFVWITTDDPKRITERGKQRDVLLEKRDAK